MKEVLTGAKVGDQVIIVYSKFGSEEEYIETITGITKNGNYKAGGYIFYPDGTVRGNYEYAHICAKKATNEDIDRITKRKFTRIVIKAMHDTKSLTYSQAVVIAKLLNIQGDKQ